jgi:hypothetical protein
MFGVVRLSGVSRGVFPAQCSMLCAFGVLSAGVVLACIQPSCDLYTCAGARLASSTAKADVVGMDMAGCVCIARLACTYHQVDAYCLE